MSGSFAMPHALTGGAGYKANPAYDEFLRKHSSFYRKHSAASNAQEEDRRRSSAVLDSHADAARQAVQNVAAEDAQQRRSSFTPAAGGAATANARKGSVIVASDSTRKDSLVGMEATAGTSLDPGRRPSTSLASDLYHKMKGDRKAST